MFDLFYLSPGRRAFSRFLRGGILSKCEAMKGGCRTFWCGTEFSDECDFAADIEILNADCDNRGQPQCFADGPFGDKPQTKSRLDAGDYGFGRIEFHLNV